SRQYVRRPVRALAHRPAPFRLTGCGACQLARRPRRRRSLAGAHRGPGRAPHPARRGGRHPAHARAAGPRLGRPGALSEPAQRELQGRPRIPRHVLVWLHTPRDRGFVDRSRVRRRADLPRHLLRADGQFAYQLAVVVDDAEQGVTDVVRGADLLDSTPRQIYLQRSLGYATPRYLHVPAAVNAAGEKLSKQTGARPVDLARKSEELRRALTFLGQAG